MNIVIPLGYGSRWNNNELRYCLRSIQQHVHGWERIILVGVMPDWMQPHDRLMHIPMDDKPGARLKEQNIHRKIMAAIQSGYAGERFLFMNDDHFILHDIDIANFPTHFKGLLIDAIGKCDRHNMYRTTLSNTLHYCAGKGVKLVRDYDTHAPIIYHSTTYLQHVGSIVKWPAYGYGIKSMYANLSNAGGKHYPDLKLPHVHDLAEIVAAVHGRLYFSIGDRALGPALEAFMKLKYITPSMFENEQSIDSSCRVFGAGMAANENVN